MSKSLTATGTILVFGNVKPEQYGPARFRLLEQGIRPRILRVNASEFFLSGLELDEQYSPGKTERYMEAQMKLYAAFGVNGCEHDTFPVDELYYESDELTKAFAAQHLAKFGSVYALVMDESAADRYTERARRHMYDALAAQPFGYTRWVAKADGGVEFMG